ncbi:MAG: D-alanyl-D-alanine carboxypeptidase [Myxococcales bacterium]|nr:MAG: D-alanyl-D-alanine carboxypeptidase [Myxococcales bacterium]
MLYPLGKDSSNFTAEMLLKVLGAQVGGLPGTSEKGLAVVRSLLGSPEKETLINGSGLFSGNLLSPRTLSQTLERTLAQPNFSPEFISQLSRAGEDGTLYRRLKNLPTKVSLRAKTGTLFDAVALSGVIFLEDNHSSWVFSILINDVKGRYAAARSLSDRLVRHMAAFAAKQQLGAP